MLKHIGNLEGAAIDAHRLLIPEEVKVDPERAGTRAWLGRLNLMNGRGAISDDTAQERILEYLRVHVATDENPRRFGETLKCMMAGFYRYRVGDYRLICEIQDEKVSVLVGYICHRLKSYR